MIKDHFRVQNLEKLVKGIFNKRLSLTDFGFCQDLQAEAAEKMWLQCTKKKRGRAETAQNLSGMRATCRKKPAL